MSRVKKRSLSTAQQGKVPPKSKKMKIELVDRIRSCLDSHSHLFLCTVYNMRASPLREIRENLSDVKFFIGHNRVIQIALGKSPESEYLPDLSKISSNLLHQRCLIFTNHPSSTFDYLSHYSKPDYAKSDFVATDDFKIASGIIDKSHELEPVLRKLGLNTKLENGKIILNNDTQIAKAGEKLTSNQCQLLKIFDIKMAVFRIIVNLIWSKESEKIEEIHPFEEQKIEEKN